MIPSDEQIVNTYYKVRPVFYHSTHSDCQYVHVLDAVRKMFDLLRVRQRAQKLYDFYCGEDIGLADICMWALYLKVIKVEPHLVPLIMDSYIDLGSYFSRLTIALNGKK